MSRLILVIDDEERYREVYGETLLKAGFRVQTAASADAALGLLSSRTTPDMIVTDVRMPGMDGINFLRCVAGQLPGTPCLLITAYADVRDAVTALKLGAVDYLEKPVDLDELVAAVSDALHVTNARRQDDVPAHLCEGIVAESASMRAVLRDAYQVAQTDAAVLITGESGSGKEILAKFIHRASPRAARAFVPLNCAALPASVLASELFGHERGAFTGAVARRKGIFREADGSTLFLDEIGDMPIDLQPSLLRAIETGRISPLGSDSEVSVDVRLITATNRDLTARVAAGTFREDLYYRINVIALDVPPLRERPDDILPLARHFLSRRSQSRRMSPATIRILQNYNWPGNTRELANAVERAAILSNTEILLPEHLPRTVQTGSRTAHATSDAAGVKTMSQAEDEAILAALASTEGNRTKAAALLGISRRALIYKLKRLQLPDASSL